LLTIKNVVLDTEKAFPGGLEAELWRKDEKYSGGHLVFQDGG